MDDWTCEYKGLVMGAPDSPISIVAVDGLISLPDVRTSDLALVQRHGLWPGDDYMGGRTVTVTLEIYGSTPEEFSRAVTSVQAAFAPEGPEAKFRFRFPGAAGGQTAYVLARSRKRSGLLDLNFAHLVCNVVVELFATAPEIRGDTDQRLELKSGADGQPSRSFRLTQHGAKTAMPVISITNAVNPVIENVTTGTRFGVTYTGALTIDTRARRITASTGATLAPAAGSTWPELPPGEYLLRFRHDDASKSATADLTWDEQWI
ncbi:MULTISPECIES: phage distal tail protein [Streptomyces]|uniref:phage distal tail protein n=1 Tax=Streptomyces TaxID=1883 RepID=UPI00345BAA4C